ncbi:MAG: hypothetical protein F6K47_04515 [Symploca sp. SIO2E6]|nr:hypothetical protein [Symploca sp. SIO2E6]
MTIYQNKLFNLSELTFKVKDSSSLDSLGNPISANDSTIVIKAQLDGIGFAKTLYIASPDTGKTDETDITYIGHCVEPRSLPPEIKAGAVGTGVVNGEEGEIRLLPVDQPSIGLARRVFGDRIKIKFIRRVSTVS